MAGVNPRASGLWREVSSMGQSVHSDDGDVESGAAATAGDYDGRTPLERTIDRIGMGPYQWTLLSLCGFGWMADNMWIEAVAIALPRVQRHFNVPDGSIGVLPATMHAGMMFGAIGWGACSDLMGRTTAFNATLVLTAAFGVLASLVSSFPALCGALFLLGSAVGGSMPTDGTLVLEYMPKSKQYLVTALSVFFSLGAVFSAIVALLLIPSSSCPALPAPCTPAENSGWQHMFSALGLATLVMFAARIVFFKLHESPRYLVSAGRHAEAIQSLQLISRFNGSELSLDLADVQDIPAGDAPPPSRGPHSRSPPPRAHPTRMSSETGLFSASPTHAGYESITPPSAEEEEAKPVSEEGGALVRSPLASPPRRPAARPTPLPSHRLSKASVLSKRSSLHEVESKLCGGILPAAIRRPLVGWLDRMALVLNDEWRRTTVLMWLTWFFMSLAFTMFNVFLPKLLETSPTGTREKSIEESLWDVVVFTLGGCPGALLGAWMVESTLGRRLSLASSTFATAFTCIAFALADGPWAVRTSTLAVSLAATTMWAVLYGWTPEVFATEVRSSACGVASALSRVGGMTAPLVGSALLAVDRTWPVYCSILVFGAATLSVLLLRGGEERRGQYGALH